MSKSVGVGAGRCSSVERCFPTVHESIGQRGLHSPGVCSNSPSSIWRAGGHFPTYPTDNVYSERRPSYSDLILSNRGYSLGFRSEGHAKGVLTVSSPIAGAWGCRCLVPWIWGKEAFCTAGERSKLTFTLRQCAPGSWSFHAAKLSSELFLIHVYTAWIERTDSEYATLNILLWKWVLTNAGFVTHTKVKPQGTSIILESICASLSPVPCLTDNPCVASSLHVRLPVPQVSTENQIAGALVCVVFFFF